MHILTASGFGTIDSTRERWRRMAQDIAGMWELVFLRVHWMRVSGSGTDTAPLTLSANSLEEPMFDMDLHTIQAVGVGADLFLRIPRDERDQWVFLPTDEMRISWINADANIRWAYQLGITDA